MIDEYITDVYAAYVCKPGTVECCRYLTMHPAGWSCEKHGELKAHLDKRVAEGSIRAVGDNCEGRKSRG